MAMAYDHLRDRTVAFGGIMGVYVPVSDTMELDGDTWTVRATTMPPGRFGHRLVYDSERAEVILFGGGNVGPVLFADTWAWNGSVWTQRAPANSPPGGVGFSMTYDEARRRTVWFAGQETWEWDGTDWLQRSSTHVPPARTDHAAAYDSRRGRVVVFGGYGTLTDTWEWDGSDWQQGALTGLQPVVYFPRMAFDRERGRCVMLGMAPTVPSATLCHEYDGISWSAAATAPFPLGDLAYDRQRGRVVHFVGRDSNGTYSGTTWSYEVPTLGVAQPYGVGIGSPPLAVREDPTARPLLGNTLRVDIENVPAGAAFMCFGWSNRQVLNLTLPARLDSFGLTGS